MEWDLKRYSSRISFVVSQTAVALLLLLTVHCRGAVRLEHQLRYPARIPLHIYPSVGVVQGELPEERELARALAQDLRDEGVVKKIVLLPQDFSPQTSSMLPEATVYLQFRATLTRQDRWFAPEKNMRRVWM